LSAKIIEDHRVVCLTTVSLVEILNLYTQPDYWITWLDAKASNIDMEGSLDITIKELGFEGQSGIEMNSFMLNYRADFDENGNMRNPLDKSNRMKLESAKKQLDIHDAAVSQVRVLLRDPEIGEIAPPESGNGEDLWHMKLLSKPVESGKDRELLMNHPVNQELVREYKFQHRLLHLLEMIDRKQELTVPKTQRKPLIHWYGTTSGSLNSKKTFARYMKDHHFGDEYKAWKQYGTTEEEEIILVDISR